MPSVYHWGGRSLDEAKISQAEQARAGEAICRPSDRSATPAAATWTAAAATAGTRGAAFGRAARPIPTATRAPPAPSTTTGRVHTDSAGRRASASAGAASSAASAESTATCCATGDCATWSVSHTPPSAAAAARSRSSQIWSGRAARSAPAVTATSASTSQRLGATSTVDRPAGREPPTTAVATTATAAAPHTRTQERPTRRVRATAAASSTTAPAPAPVASTATCDDQANQTSATSQAVTAAVTPTSCRASRTPPTARTRRVGRSWVLVWGGAAVAVVATAVVAGSRPAGLSTVQVAPSLWLVLALVAGTAGALLAARPLQVRELRDLAAAAALGGVWLTLQVAQSPVAAQVAVLLSLIHISE